MTAVSQRQPLLRVSAITWETIFSTVAAALIANVCLALATSPLLVLLITTDPRASWPALALAAVASVPALPALFGVFRHLGTGRIGGVLSAFWSGWWRTMRRSLAVGSAVIGLAVVVGVDLVVLGTSRWAVALGGFLLVVLALGVATAVLALVASVERPDARLRDVLKASIYLAVKRWYLSLFTLVILAMQAALFTLHPAIAVGLTAAPLLYALWGNSRFTLAPVLPPGSRLAT
ncbi:ferredoxin-NADPH reductase [Pseudactinotalea sp.]|uniref:ferredoxin-NADPH reductase n=1 Tax=Pseudactinotalea sp. TaxID=1926260 RepID=UPI003B3A53FD